MQRLEVIEYKLTIWEEYLTDYFTIEFAYVFIFFDAGFASLFDRPKAKFEAYGYK